MRVPAARRPAVVVAAIATALILGLVGVAPTQAKDPPGLDRFMVAVARVESGGNHKAVNKTSGAYGKYQIMPDNWRAWARRYLGNANAKPTAANQEKVARAKMKSLYAWLGSWQRVSYWWLTGSSRTSAWSRAATSYVSRVMAYFGGPEPGEETKGLAPLLGAKRGHRLRGIVEGGAPWRLRRRGRALRHGRRRDRHDHLQRQPDRLVRPRRPDPRQGPDQHRRPGGQDGQPEALGASTPAPRSTACRGRRPVRIRCRSR